MKTTPLYLPSWTVFAVPVALRLLLHLFSIENYGYFIDEYYYLASIHHLDTGYVDHPPLSIWLLYLVVPWAGNSIIVIRILSALAGVGTILIAMRITYRLGGGRSAMLLTGLFVCLNPIFLGVGKYYSMNSLDLLLWSAAVLSLDNCLRTNAMKQWILFGFIIGLALLNKHGAFMLGAGMVTGILASGGMTAFQKPGPYVAGLLALIVFSPNLLWQFEHGFPTLEFIANASSHKNYFAWRDFFSGLVLENNPLALPVWLGGALSLFLPGNKQWRWLGVCFLVVLALILSGQGKSYYLAPIMPALFAAGAVWIESMGRSQSWKRITGTSPNRREERKPGAEKKGISITEQESGQSQVKSTSDSGPENGLPLSFPLIGPWIAGSALAIVLLSGLLLTPFSLPLLSPQNYIGYETLLGLRAPKMEKRKEGPLPQHFADMFGWKNLQQDVLSVYEGLPVKDRDSTVIVALNYGLAGSLDLLHRQGRLPAVGSGHNSYFLWGPPESRSGRITRIIFVGFDRKRVEGFAPGQILQEMISGCQYCMPSRESLPIFVFEPESSQPPNLLRLRWDYFRDYI